LHWQSNTADTSETYSLQQPESLQSKLMNDREQLPAQPTAPALLQRWCRLFKECIDFADILMITVNLARTICTK